MTKVASPRQQAQNFGFTKYHGSPCKKCGGTERYVSSTVCVPCDRKRCREKSRVARVHGLSLRVKYGLDVATYEAMKAEQNECCAICGVHERKAQDKDPNRYRLHVDHNHKTKKVRALLCRRCNLILGWANEDVGILQKSIEYLKYHEDFDSER